MKALDAIVLVLLAFVATLAASCAGGPQSLYQRLQNEDPQVRVQAVVEAGRSHDRQALPLLVERLNDSEEEVRFFTILALERITKQTMGYRFYDSPKARQEAVDRWRAYLATGATTAPATAPASAPTTAPASLPATAPTSSPATTPAQRSAS